MKCANKDHFSRLPIGPRSALSASPRRSPRPFRSTPSLAFGGVGEVLIGAMGEFATKSPYKGEYVAEIGAAFLKTSRREIPQGFDATSR